MEIRIPIHETLAENPIENRPDLLRLLVVRDVKLRGLGESHAPRERPRIGVVIRNSVRLRALHELQSMLDRAQETVRVI